MPNKERKKHKDITEVLSTPRFCHFDGKELNEDNIAKGAAIHKRWYVCRECFNLKIKKRWSKLKTSNPVHYKAVIMRRPLVNTDATTDYIENLIKEKLGTPCPYCKDTLTLGTISLDHKQPQSLGGTHNRDNLEMVCYGCNMRKGALAKEDYEWLLLVLDDKPLLKKSVLARLGGSGWKFRG